MENTILYKIGIYRISEKKYEHLLLKKKLMYSQKLAINDLETLKDVINFKFKEYSNFEGNFLIGEVVISIKGNTLFFDTFISDYKNTHIFSNKKHQMIPTIISGTTVYLPNKTNAQILRDSINVLKIIQSIYKGCHIDKKPFVNLCRFIDFTQMINNKK